MIFWPSEDSPVKVGSTECSRRLVFESSLHVRLLPATLQCTCRCRTGLLSRHCPTVWEGVKHCLKPQYLVGNIFFVVVLKVVVYRQRTCITILTCSNNNFVLMYYELVSKFNNGIHNLLQFTSNQKCASVYTCTYLSPNLHFSIQTQIAQVLSRLFLSTGKAFQFYTSSNMAISGKSTVDLLVIAFFSKCGTFFAKIASCRPSTSWKGKNGSQLLHVVYCILGEIFG